MKQCVAVSCRLEKGFNTVKTSADGLLLVGCFKIRYGHLRTPCRLTGVIESLNKRHIQHLSDA